MIHTHLPGLGTAVTVPKAVVICSEAKEVAGGAIDVAVEEAITGVTWCCGGQRVSSAAGGELSAAGLLCLAVWMDWFGVFICGRIDRVYTCVHPNVLKRTHLLTGGMGIGGGPSAKTSPVSSKGLQPTGVAACCCCVCVMTRALTAAEGAQASGDAGGASPG